jgi:hypothetical protein
MENLMSKSEFIKKLYLADYKIGGRSLDEGLDCWGVVVEYYKNVLGLTNIGIYEEMIFSLHYKKVTQQIKDFLKRDGVQLDGPREHAVCVINFHGIPLHSGIMLNDHEVLNLFRKEILIEDYRDYKKEDRIYGFFTTPEFIEKYGD